LPLIPIDRAIEAFLTYEKGQKYISVRSQTLYDNTFRHFKQRFPEYVPFDPLEIGSFLTTFSRNTGRLIFAHLHCFYRWLNDFNPAIPDAMAKMRRPSEEKKRIKFLAMDEVNALAALPMDNQDKVMVSLLLATGIRIGELVSLDREDVEECTIQVKGKTGVRNVPLGHPELRNQMCSLVDSGPLFRDQNGKRFTSDGAANRIRRLLLQIGCNKGPHVLRHTVATQALRHGVDSLTIQKLLGHTTLTMTRLYAQVAEADALAKQDLATPYALIQRQKARALPEGRGE